MSGSPPAHPLQEDKEQSLEAANACHCNRDEAVCVSSLTQRVGGRSLEDEPVGCEENGSLSREQRRTSHQPRGLFAPV